MFRKIQHETQSLTTVCVILIELRIKTERVSLTRSEMKVLSLIIFVLVMLVHEGQTATRQSKSIVLRLSVSKNDRSFLAAIIKMLREIKKTKGFKKAKFTNLGASGRYGPSSTGGQYNGQDHQGQVTLSSGIQIWTVPFTGSYRIEAVGASGGYDNRANSRSYRGRGAKMIGTFALRKGDRIKILVGQEGGINTKSQSSGGGGGSFVSRYDNRPLIVAGGGGGIESAKKHHSRSDGTVYISGNPGFGGSQWAGGSNGQGATKADSGNSGGGGGGFNSSGRSSKQFGGSFGYGGEGGKGFLQGGVGGRSKVNGVFGGFGGGGGAYGNGGGAGGGGGYSGGASGDNNNDSSGGGGGSYNSGSDQSNTCCYNSQGHGYVLISAV